LILEWNQLQHTLNTLYLLVLGGFTGNVLELS
jgi:hypothetical protein